MKLHDNTIAHIAKLVQMAIITGTDVVDHLRMMDLEVKDEDVLVLCEEYKKNQDLSIQDMLQKASQQ